MKQHPSFATLYAAAIRSLPETHQALVNAHISKCEPCQKAMRTAAKALGDALDDLPPSSTPPDAFENAKARAASGSIRRLRPPPPPIDWRAVRLNWLGPGIRGRVVYRQGDETLLLFRVAPGYSLPRHTHAGREMTLVLAGDFEDAGLRCDAGDITEAEPERDHSPAAAGSSPTFFMVAATGGPLRFHSPFICLQQLLGRI